VLNLTLFQEFTNSILALGASANVVLVGDFDEVCLYQQRLYTPFDDIVTEINESSGLDPHYIFDQNHERLVRSATKVGA